MGEDKTISTMANSPFEIPSSESASDKLIRKARDAPFLPIGLAGLLGVLGFGAYKFKHRGAMSTSVFLMQLRVAAQGTVVACLTLGLVYNMSKQFLLKKEDDIKKQ